MFSVINSKFIHTLLLLKRIFRPFFQSTVAKTIGTLSAKRNLHSIAAIFIMLLMTLLSSCSHVSRQDGPPNFYVDETKIPNAVPKPERLSKYGNMTSYRVFGKRYYTLHSSKRYDQVGTASWYGTKFHAQRTSSGERYNMLAMTAAHKTLPLPTYVEVTNLANRRTIVVKVNDRGPFESNRIIDLSYVAAKKLGMIGHGTARVRVKAIDPYAYGKQPEFANNWNFSRPHKTKRNLEQQHQLVYLQVGAFRNKSHAEKLKKRLVVLLEAPVKILNPSTRGLYRVKIGPIKDVATAEKITTQLKNLGISSNKTNGT